MRVDLHKYLTFILSIFAFWLGVVPFLFSKTLPVVCENLSYNTPYSISVEKPRLYLNVIPNAIVSFDKLNIQSKQTGDKLFIDKFRLNIRILPLLSGRIHINNINAENIDVMLFLNKKAELDKNILKNLQKARITCDAANIENTKLNIKQSFEGDDIIIYSAKKLFYKKTGRYIKLIVDSDFDINKVQSTEKINIYLPKNNNVNKSTIDIHISNFDIKSLTEYLKNFLPSDFVKAAGTVDIDVTKQHISALFNNVSVIMKDDTKSIIFPEKVSIESELQFTGKSIQINNAKIVSKRINILLNGIISNYIDRAIPDYNINIQVNNSKIEDIISMLPSFKTEDIDIFKLKKYKFYGDILGNLTVKGSDYEPSINGSVYVNNGILTKPIPNANGATVKLDFKGKYLNYDVSVPAGISEKVWVKGGVELYNVKYADMRVWSTKSVDLALAEEKVIPVHEILNFVIGPVPIMDIKGTGNIDITIKGNRQKPHVWGGLNFKNTTVNFIEIPDLIMTNANATLVFNDENAVFNLQNGFVNGKDIKIDGICNLAGKFDFDVKTENQDLKYLYNALITSTMIEEIKRMIPKTDDCGGLTNLKLKVYGNIKDIAQLKFKENFSVRGTLDFLGNSVIFQGIKIHDLTGSINFENTDAQINLSSNIGHSVLQIIAAVKDNFADAAISVKNLNLRDVVANDEKFRKEFAGIFIDVEAKYKGKTDFIERDKISFDAQILKTDNNNKLKLSNGKISLKNGKLIIKDIKGFFPDENSEFDINLQADNIAANPVFNGYLKLKNFELSLVNFFSEYKILPKNITDILKQIYFQKGKISLDAKISNNNINTSFNIGGIEFKYTPLDLPMKIINGSVYIRKNYLGLNKINLITDDMPLLIDGGIANIFDKPNCNLYLNSKPKQTFIDKYININRIYPLKIKGDIVCWLKLKGTKDNYNVEAETNIANGSMIYYLGATVGDIENAIILNLNMNVLNQNIMKIKEFSYDKLIDSQGKRKTRLNMLKAYGGINAENGDLIFKDLRVKTSHPTDARIFNIIFRKSNIKQGQFSSDLRFNGSLSNPQLIGNFHIVETNIPFLDTTMKKISLVFKDKTINLYSKGEILGSDVVFEGTLRNSLKTPYYIENADIYLQNLDFNDITYKLKTSHVDELPAIDPLANFDINNVLIKKLKLNADQIKLRNIEPKNVTATISLTEKNVLNINSFKFNIAEGVVNGKFSYNMLNDNMWIHLDAKDINANDITIALFNLPNQIHGTSTGNVKLACNGKDFNNCMETLNGSLMFDVRDGRMPKLGSLEYLLKAGNLLKGGLTGLSINSVIDILTPLKTGNFSEIYGTMNIKDGVTDNIEIATRGKDLSLFITGKYNFGSSDAEMVVLGMLSKKISTMFGPLGNVSLNTLFNVVPGIDLTKDSKMLDKINKIPGIELNSKLFRKFIAEINGNINGENYVTSFKWIN